MKGGVADLFERPSSGTRALLVHAGARGEDPERATEEFVELVRATGAEPVDLVTAALRRRDPRHFVGAGKAEELRGRVETGAIELAIFNHRLTPAQERNLEALLKCRVLDRIGLILDIFAQRASTFEGRLQVELAQLRHLSTRLVRGWTHLERQRGGIGLRGPGETQLETDRRLVGKRIERIGRQLDAVQRRREVNRRPRRRSRSPGGLARRLHERRQVDPLQSSDGGRGARGRSALRDPRPHPAADDPAGRKPLGAGGYGRVRGRSAARAGGRLPRHPRGDPAGGSAAARDRREWSGRPRASRAGERGAGRDRSR